MSLPVVPSVSPGKPQCDLLILDDMFLIRLALAAIAEEAGISVCEAEDSTEALERLDRMDCRVLLADVNLGPNSPIKNGKDVAAEAMRLYPALCVIYTSALPVDLGRKLLPRERVLQKPYPQDELVHMLQELLRDGADQPVISTIAASKIAASKTIAG